MRLTGTIKTVSRIGNGKEQYDHITIAIPSAPKVSKAGGGLTADPVEGTTARKARLVGQVVSIEVHE